MAPPNLFVLPSQEAETALPIDQPWPFWPETQTPAHFDAPPLTTYLEAPRRLHCLLGAALFDWSGCAGEFCACAGASPTPKTAVGKLWELGTWPASPGVLRRGNVGGKRWPWGEARLRGLRENPDWEAGDLGSGSGSAVDSLDDLRAEASETPGTFFSTHRNLLHPGDGT